MSGPRVTSGEDSKQDYGTPADLLAPVGRRFGPILFDVAAHAVNHKHARYFAPPVLTGMVEPGDSAQLVGTLTADLLAQGGLIDEVGRAIANAIAKAERTKEPARVSVRNYDACAVALDAFQQRWPVHVGPGVNWLNCEFDDCGRWAKKTVYEATRGVSTTLLTPAAVGANWFVENLAGVADVYLLWGRLMFDGKNVFPKDCMLSHCWPGATGAMHVWDWAADKIIVSWTGPRIAAAPQLGLF